MHERGFLHSINRLPPLPFDIGDEFILFLGVIVGEMAGRGPGFGGRPCFMFG